MNFFMPFSFRHLFLPLGYLSLLFYNSYFFISYFTFCYGLPSLSRYLTSRYRIPLEEATVSPLVKKFQILCKSKFHYRDHRSLLPSFIAIVLCRILFSPLLMICK